MPTIEHSVLPDGDLHEPKGVSTATAGKVYVSDGATSGSWLTPYVVGVETFGDTGTAQALTSGAWVDLTNDGAGAATNETYRLPDRSAIWDTTTNEFNWVAAGLELGDTVLLRFVFEYFANLANNRLEVRLDMAHEDIAEYIVPVATTNFDIAGTYSLVHTVPIVMGDTATLTNPAKVSAYSSSTLDTVAFTSVTATVLPRKVVFA